MSPSASISDGSIPPSITSPASTKNPGTGITSVTSTPPSTPGYTSPSPEGFRPHGTSHSSHNAGQPTPSSNAQLQKGSHDGSGHVTQSNGVSPGETAGIAIGTAIIGAAIAALIVFLLMRRSNRNARRDIGRDAPVPLAERHSGADISGAHEWEKKPTSLVAPVRTQQGIPALEHILPQPIDTKYLNNELSTLRSLIRNHLNNFFNTRPIERQLLASSIEPSALAEIANDTPFTADEWINLLASGKTRMNALRFIFAWVIFRRLEPECEPTKTLLPPGMTACYRHMSEFPDRKQVGAFLQSKWRVITGHLIREQYVTRAFTESDDRLANLQDTSRMLDAVLRPLGIEELDTARKENMSEVLKRAASIGFTLASQPSSWIFDWEPPNHGQQATPLVVFPSLIQHTNDEGQNPTESLEIGEKELGNSILISE